MTKAVVLCLYQRDPSRAVQVFGSRRRVYSFSSSYQLSMKRSPSNSLFFVLLAVFSMASLTSCNRGVGCPTNFSLNELLHDCVSVAVTLL